MANNKRPPLHYVAWLILFYVLMGLFACAPALSRGTAGKLVSAVLLYGTGHACDAETLRCDRGPGTWRESPYHRLEDLTSPMYVFLAGDGTACPVWNLRVQIPKRGDVFDCPTSWRAARP